MSAPDPFSPATPASKRLEQATSFVVWTAALGLMTGIWLVSSFPLVGAVLVTYGCSMMLAAFVWCFTPRSLGRACRRALLGHPIWLATLGIGLMVVGGLLYRTHNNQLGLIAFLIGGTTATAAMLCLRA